MKKTVLAVLILLLLAFTLPSVPRVRKVSATTTEDLRHVTTLPEPEPIPESTTEDYLNTTNPYSQINPLGEETDEEGSHPLYVLVFGDEEERPIVRRWIDDIARVEWDWWAKIQLERGDNFLVAEFGIDIRILDFLEWDSDDSIEYMDDPYGWDLCDELLADKGHYLRTWYDGEWWSNYVDAIIGITYQKTPKTPGTIGVAPSLNELNQGKIFVLLKWQVYWMDDNLVQHEVSHLYYAPDHPEPQPPAPCCAMAYHTHFQIWIYEGKLWNVWSWVSCSMTAYSWCTSCHQVIQQNSGRYPLRTLTISASTGGTTNPTPGTYIYGNGESVTVTATPDSGCYFNYWVLDETKVYDNPVTVTMDSDHDLKAHFTRASMKTRADGYFYVPNVATDLLKVEMLFDDTLVGDQTGGTSPYGSISNWPDGKVDLNDLLFIEDGFWKVEGDDDWDYMLDIVPDGKCGLDDLLEVIDHYWGTGTYITDLTAVTVTFNTGETKSPDSDGFVTIPQDATSFTVKRYGNPIGAMIIFW